MYLVSQGHCCVKKICVLLSETLTNFSAFVRVSYCITRKFCYLSLHRFLLLQDFA